MPNTAPTADLLKAGWRHALARDRFHTAWWDRDRERSNRYAEGREIDRDVRLAQEARQMIGDELVNTTAGTGLAPKPARPLLRAFAADGRVTDELSLELQERYLSGATEQERRWAERIRLMDRGQRRAESRCRGGVRRRRTSNRVTEHVDHDGQAERRAGAAGRPRGAFGAAARTSGGHSAPAAGAPFRQRLRVDERGPFRMAGILSRSGAANGWDLGGLAARRGGAVRQR